MARTLNFDRMSLQQLQELFEIDRAIQDTEVDDTISQLQETSMDIIGKKGRGKTMSGVAVAYQLRERFNRPVICIGSKMGLDPNTFGPFQIMNEKDFRDELERIDIAASEEESAEAIAKAFDKYGISILYATIIFDEAYKMFEARRSADKLVQLAGYFMAQQRHYHVTTIFMSPTEEMIDKRIVGQVDWHGRCFFNKYTGICTTRFTQGLQVLTLEIDSDEDTLHPPYKKMYNSWAMLGYRKTSLSIKQE